MKKRIQRIGISIAICICIGLFSTIIVQYNAEPWYDLLRLPSYSPSFFMIALTWVLSYGLIGAASGIVWSHGFYHRWVKVALYHSVFQLLLHAAWVILLFGIHSPMFALIDIIATLILFFFTFKWFKIVNTTAAYLLLPYIIFVIFTTVLSYQIWFLNS